MKQPMINYLPLDTVIDNVLATNNIATLRFNHVQSTQFNQQSSQLCLLRQSCQSLTYALYTISQQQRPQSSPIWAHNTQTRSQSSCAKYIFESLVVLLRKKSCITFT